MSVTCGFFNAVNHDRKYDAKQMSSIFNGIINDGVFMNIGNAMVVKANPDNENVQDMNVYVFPGRAWFDSTWTLIDAIEPLEIEPAELVLDRIDTVVLEVNQNDEVRACLIKVVKGTPSTNPVAATMENSEYVHQHALARIKVKSGVAMINQADITNCIGTSETPYITGILETIDADNLLIKWQSQFELWFQGLEEDGDKIISSNTSKFMDWFDRLSVVLDGDVASHLQNEIEHIFEALVINGNIITDMKDTITNDINKSIADMKVSFQAGVDTVYNACVAVGSTPADKSPTAIAKTIRIDLLNNAKELVRPEVEREAVNKIELHDVRGNLSGRFSVPCYWEPEPPDHGGITIIIGSGTKEYTIWTNNTGKYAKWIPSTCTGDASVQEQATIPPGGTVKGYLSGSVWERPGGSGTADAFYGYVNTSASGTWSGVLIY